MKLFRNHTFNWWEVGVVKVCLISLGILLGLYFTKELMPYLQLWWGLFIITALYFIARFVNKGQ